MTKRALVTGAAGFVGAVLTRKLSREGHEVHAVVSPRIKEAARWRLRGLDLSVHAVDLADEPAVRELVERVRAE